MARFTIACLPGDGVGPDVMEAAEIVLKALKFDHERVYGDVGWEFWCKEGDALPQRTIDLCKNSHAALFGAVVSKPRPEAMRELAPALQGQGHVYHHPLVRLRQEFGLHTNVRPCKGYPGARNYAEGLDIVIFRENSEGLYSGIEFHPVPEDVFAAMTAHSKGAQRFANAPRESMAMTVRVVTEAAAHRIVTKAFEFAQANGRKRVTLIDKANVLRETGGMMVHVAEQVAAQYPDIAFEVRNIDQACMHLMRNPLHFDVIVAANEYGDIVSDICAQMVGGMGFAPSANLGETWGLFEPVHGPAPEIGGQKIVNPIATLLSIKLMLDFLGEPRQGRRLEDAVESVIRVGTVRTHDMGGSATTKQLAEEVVRKL